MPDTNCRAIAEAFYKASEARDLARIAPMLAEDVDWLVQGPVEVFPFLGHRRGREAVLRGYAEIAQHLDVTGYEVEALLVDGNRAAALIRLTALVRAIGRVMCIRTSQFSRFRDGQVYEMHAVLDSFDMVEQTIGYPLDLRGQGKRAPIQAKRDVAVKSAAVIPLGKRAAG